MNDPNIIRLAGQQHGVVSTAQLVHLGIAPRTISYARQRGEVERVLPGVLRSPGYPLTFEARAMAVQLHTDPDGALGGPTAARIYGLRQMPEG